MVRRTGSTRGGARMTQGPRTADDLGEVAPGASDVQRTVWKTSEVVAFAVARDIVQLGLQHGDRLPLEAEMLEQYGVSRESLREALRLLELEQPEGFTQRLPADAVLLEHLGFQWEPVAVLQPQLDDVASHREGDHLRRLPDGPLHVGRAGCDLAEVVRGAWSLRHSSTPSRRPGSPHHSSS